ncbi:MAG: hypothetical protein HZA54_17385 [Planctomycetes bacterium]|nr:hypothetical protein [Planctomycetota bacterium]
MLTAKRLVVGLLASVTGLGMMGCQMSAGRVGTATTPSDATRAEILAMRERVAKLEREIQAARSGAPIEAQVAAPLIDEESERILSEMSSVKEERTKLQAEYALIAEHKKMLDSGEQQILARIGALAMKKAAAAGKLDRARQAEAEALALAKAAQDQNPFKTATVPPPVLAPDPDGLAAEAALTEMALMEGQLIEELRTNRKQRADIEVEIAELDQEGLAINAREEQVLTRLGRSIYLNLDTLEKMLPVLAEKSAAQAEAPVATPAMPPPQPKPAWKPTPMATPAPVPAPMPPPVAMKQVEKAIAPAAAKKTISPELQAINEELSIIEAAQTR